MDLSALILAAFSFVRPPATTDDAVRYAELADTIAAVSLDAPAWPVTSEEAEGSAEVAATGLLLASVALHESGIDSRVGSCRILGPRRAASYFQLESLGGYVRDDVCASTEIAARVAGGILVMHRRRCPRCVDAQIVAAYASGDPGRGSKAAREIVNLWWSLAGRAGLYVYPYSSERPRWR